PYRELDFQSTSLTRDTHERFRLTDFYLGLLALPVHDFTKS
ncbi:hypothetical protein SAMN02745121_09232, partial [Nannocystis exedens]